MSLGSDLFGYCANGDWVLAEYFINMEGDNEFVEECSYNCMPEIGMAFDYEDSAYQFYNTYARSVGFSIRRSDAHKSNGILRKRKFCCSKEGFKGVDKRKALQPQPETRTGCEAHMVIIYQSSGSYLVSKFEEKHNHDLVPTPLCHNLRSHRKIGKAQTAQVDIIDGSGLAPKTVMDLMSGQVGGRRNLGFVLNDVKSYLRTKRETRMENGIAGQMKIWNANYLAKKQFKNDIKANRAVQGIVPIPFNPAIAGGRIRFEPQDLKTISNEKKTQSRKRRYFWNDGSRKLRLFNEMAAMTVETVYSDVGLLCRGISGEEEGENQ
ncbi:putative protein FAR1-RELATED SEQUENCE 10 [Acorus gramineus]|uniref:FAR1 domain-containing protein n=1 Tax=Acorus gramineus TaxID=55184 RepID=A0AAV9APP9_ACOGR|nr:putative protein FAR1-RELATED SEQUENCE 10 [Acorus gramineus]